MKWKAKLFHHRFPSKSADIYESSKIFYHKSRNSIHLLFIGHFLKEHIHIQMYFFYYSLYFSPYSELLNHFSCKKQKITLCLKMPFISTQTTCLSLLTMSDIPKAKCNSSVLCVWRQAASVIIILKYGDSLQSRTSVQQNVNIHLFLRIRWNSDFFNK